MLLMRYDKKRLLTISKKIIEKKPIQPSELSLLLTFEKLDKDSRPMAMLKKVALPISLAFGFFFTAFPDYFNNLVKHMPSWTNLSPAMLSGVDYLWDLLGDPIGRPNVIYHIPNIVLYSVGFFGLKKVIDSIDKRTWLDRVLSAQSTLQENITNGKLNLQLKKGHSLLFVGNGDFIGTQFVFSHMPEDAITISQNKPSFTNVWNYYDEAGLYDDLKDIIIRSGGENAGEYIFFPVKDDQIFLPGGKSYDLAPHRLDILCQNIRVIEKELRWKPKRIIIIGDKFHKSFVQSEDKNRVVAKSADTISLGSIAKKYKNVTLLDPSDIVLKKIITIAAGRKIVFRATLEGLQEYKKRFYDRLNELGYKQNSKKKGVLTIGYDLFEDQTEQQTLSRKIDDYFPVVLSINVRDALIRNGYKKTEFLYVPDLVLQTLTKTAAEQ
jgi:hypothetical protein